MIDILKVISQGGFTSNLKSLGNNEFSIMKGSIDDTISNISSMLYTIQDSFFTVNESSKILSNISDEMAASTSEISSSIQNVSESTGSQAFDLSKITEITNLINTIAEQIRKLSEQSKLSSENITLLINHIFKDTELMIKTTNIMNNELSKQKSNISTAIGSYNIIKTAVDEIPPKIEAVDSSVVNLNANKNYIIEKLDLTSSIAENISSSAIHISTSLKN